MSATGTPRPLLVFGADGQVGFELLRALAPLGPVIGVTRADADLTDPDAVRRVVREASPAVVVNAAAYTAVDAAEGDAERCWAVNAAAPGVMGEAAEECGAAFVHYSTDYVFDGTARAPYRESDATNPLGVYGASKLAGEQAALAASPACVVFRLSWVYGTRGRNFLRTMLRLAREREELRVVSDQVGAPTWCAAIADGTAAAIQAATPEGATPREALAAHTGVYHLGAGGQTSWHGFAEAILAADPAAAEQRARRVVPIATSDFPTPARRPAYSVLDSGRAAAAFGVRLPEWREQLTGALRG